MEVRNVEVVPALTITAREMEERFDVGEVAVVLKDFEDVRWRYRELMRSLREQRTSVRTMYKRKDRKVLPVNIPLADGAKPGGDYLWKELSVERKMAGKTSEQHYGKTVLRGSRLTPERIAKMKIGNGFLSPEERAMFLEMLFEYEGVFAFDDSEMGTLDPRIEPPVVINTVPHSPWQQQNLRLPKAMLDMATDMVKGKLKSGLIEPSQGPYRSRYFLTTKKEPGTWRMINDVQPLNKVTIRDAGMPPGVDEFSEEFAGYPVTTSIDFYSGYNQILLEEKYRDLTAFMTVLGLMRATRLPMGWTNSVAVFQRIMSKVLWRHIPEHVRVFLDDLGIRGPKERYNDEEIAHGIRRFVWEHAQVVRAVLDDIWRSGLTISGAKSCFGMAAINIV